MNHLTPFFSSFILVCLFPSNTLGQEVAIDTTSKNEIVTMAGRSRTTQAKVHFKNAEQYESGGEIENALEELNQGIALKHDYSEALWLRARLHQHKGGHAEALTDYQSLLFLNPEMIEPRFERAQLFFQLERYEEAIEDFRFLLENELGETTTVYFRGVTQTNAEGKSSFSAQSMSTVQSGIKAEVWNFLGLCYLELKNYEKASLFFELALTHYTENSDIFSNLGLTYERSGDTIEAIDYYRKALLIDSDHTVALQNFSYLTRKYNRLDIAETTFAQIADEVSTSESMLHQGMMLHQLGQYQQAIAKFDEALLQSPNDADIYLQRGFSRDKLRQYKEALEDYTNALALNSYLEKAYLNRGNVYYKLKKFKDAEHDYCKALQLAPDNAKTYHNLGLVYHRKSEIDKACQYLNRAWSMNYAQSKIVIDKICNYP